jgi:transposase
MEALSLKSQGLAPEDIARLCAISKATFYRDLHAYRTGGIEKLHEVSLHRRQSPLTDYRTSIAADFRQRPPASVAEAAARIADLTGLARGPTQVRQFLKALGMKPRKVGQIPAKAAVTAQDAFKTGKREPRLEEAKAGQRLSALWMRPILSSPHFSVSSGALSVFLSKPPVGGSVYMCWQR